MKTKNLMVMAAILLVVFSFSVFAIDNPLSVFDNQESQITQKELKIIPPAPDEDFDQIAETTEPISSPVQNSPDGSPTRAPSCGSVPTDGCDVTASTTFTQGAYNLANGINIVANDVVLDCNGATLYSGAYTNIGINVYGVSNVEIKNCNIAQYASGIYVANGDGITLSNNQVLDNKRGIDVFNITNSLFRYNRISQNTPNNGLFMRFSRDVVFYKNNISANTQKGLSMESNCNIDIVANKIFNDENYEIHLVNSDSYESGSGQDWDLSECDYAYLIENNTINKASEESQMGIRVNSLNNDYEHLTTTIRGNSFTNMMYGAIKITYNTAPLKILDNTFYDNTWFDVGLYGNAHNVEVAHNNGTFDLDWYGIYSEGLLTNFSAHNNNFSLYGAGISIQDNPNAKNVNIYENDIFNCYAAIPIYDSKNISVYNNVLHNNEGGLDINGDPSGIRVYLNSIYDNTVVNVESQNPIELSNAGYGNYWGHSSPPCFDPYTDTWPEATGVVDSNAICSGSVPELFSTTIPIPNSFSWYFVSFNVDPDDDYPESVLDPSLNPIPTHLAFAKTYMNNNPEVYFPDDPWGSTLEHMTYKKGYWMKTYDAPSHESLVVKGSSVDVCTTQNLLAGIHWIGYWGDEPMPVEDAFAGLNYEWVRAYINEIAYTYNPAQPELSDLHYVQPGQAYRIKMLSSGTVDYGTCG